MRKEGDEGEANALRAPVFLKRSMNDEATNARRKKVTEGKRSNLQVRVRSDCFDRLLVAVREQTKERCSSSVLKRKRMRKQTCAFAESIHKKGENKNQRIASQSTCCQKKIRRDLIMMMMMMTMSEISGCSTI